MRLIYILDGYLGSPARKGGRATLINLAKQKAIELAEGELRVESA